MCTQALLYGIWGVILEDTYVEKKKEPQYKCIQTHQLSHTEYVVEEHDILT